MSESVSLKTPQDSLRLFGVIILCAFLGACAGARDSDYRTASPDGQRQQTAAVAIGAITGNWANSDLGTDMNAEDRIYAQRTAQDALEYNKPYQTSTWRNPGTGNSGTIKPVSTFKNTSGKDCRAFETSVFVNGDQEKGTGTACRDPDGTWHIES